MTATRETIEKDEHRLVTPEPENKTEAPILEAIEHHYCQFDNAHFAFTANWIGWVASNDISKDHLYHDHRGCPGHARKYRETQRATNPRTR